MVDRACSLGYAVRDPGPRTRSNGWQTQVKYTPFIKKAKKKTKKNHSSALTKGQAPETKKNPDNPCSSPRPNSNLTIKVRENTS